VGQLPAIAVAPQAKHFAAVAQRVSRQIVEGIHLVGARGDLPESHFGELLLQLRHVGDAELDLDFVARRHRPTV
jgi:hypothetical protein